MFFPPRAISPCLNLQSLVLEILTRLQIYHLRFHCNMSPPPLQFCSNFNWLVCQRRDVICVLDIGLVELNEVDG